MEIKSMDKAGLDFLVNEEGLILHPYLDVKKIPTIGVGMTYYPTTGKRVTMADPSITKEKAMAMFAAILIPYETAVWSVTRDDINQNQFNALCSLAYNIGVNAFKGSMVVKRVNANPADPRIGAAFQNWRRPSVLLARRKREIKLYFS